VRNIRKTLISIAFFLFFFSLISNVYAAIPISNCTVINSPGEYYLTQDINFRVYGCIKINASYVILDCQGHTISSTYAVTFSASDSILQNCNIVDSTIGVLVGYGVSVSNITIINVSVVNASNTGISVSGNNNILLNVSVSKSVLGISIYGNNNIVNGATLFLNEYAFGFSVTTYGYITKCNLTSNTYAFYVESGGGLVYTVVNDSIIFNSTYDIYDQGSGYLPIFYNNLFNSSTGNYFYSRSTRYYLNTTLTQGTNIVGGPYIGGNYWGKIDGTGYSDTCVDANHDGICDNPYALDSNNIDYLPLARYVPPPPPSLSVVFNYNSVDFGTVTPNTIAEAKSINYNVSITTNADYKVSVNATDWSGATTIPANTIYFAVNDTLDKLSFVTAKQLSNAVQQVAIFPSTVTTNYHAFYFAVPVVPAGTYTAIITITYEVV